MSALVNLVVIDELAGEALIALGRKLKPKKAGATATIGAIGGFGIEVRTNRFDELELKLARACPPTRSAAKRT